ncbi:uncharacterized protein LOC101449477 [Ceratitis capitata]|uniref:(Mediterranean fruit fly) hypothetical protein n=2 Tax=Ceratitis capitata TaxID=7213 RepID=A0A811VA99_CERCA|nr:uncharacterized protein LOC101449477 [Ceratitis capitata]CAD7012795.1 unnamed protein product [Ceratitis capitata]
MLCLKFFLSSLLCITTTLAEAPYAAGGWRPQRPFNLPADYLPPARDVGKQQQPIFDVELNKERVVFAGQIQSSAVSSANRQQTSPYLATKKQNSDFLKVQRPPYQKPAKQLVFKTIDIRPQEQQKTQIFQISKPQPQFSQRRPLRPQTTTNFAFGSEQETRVSKPAQKFGPPSSGEEQKFTINYPNPRSLKPPQQADNELEDAARLAIEALNAAKDAYNRQLVGGAVNADDGGLEADVQEVDADGVRKPSAGRNGGGGYPASRATRGQYYVLGLDNRLQLVRYTTTQSEAEARTDGSFTANLHYTPLGEIKNPIFKSNSRGQLQRIVK